MRAASAVRADRPSVANTNQVTIPVTANDERVRTLVDDAVLDVAEVTELLRIGRNTVYELVGRNEIPHRRLGKQIRFSHAALMRWLGSWSSQGAKEGQ